MVRAMVVLYSQRIGSNRITKYILWAVVLTRQPSNKRRYTRSQYVQRTLHILDIGEITLPTSVYYDYRYNHASIK